MLKPVAAVGGAMALAGAGAIGGISLMENFVIAGVKGVDACDENPVGQVGPFKSTLDFKCTAGSDVVIAATGSTVGSQYASFAASPALESVPTGEFWPLFPARNFYGIKPLLENGVAELLVATDDLATAKTSLEALSPNCPDGVCPTPELQAQFDALQSGLGAATILATPFESCEKTYTDPVAELGAPVGLATLSLIVENSVESTKASETQKASDGIADGNALLKAGNQDALTALVLDDFNYFGADLVSVCQATATSIETLANIPAGTLSADCANVVDYIAPTDTGALGARSAIADAASYVDVVEGWNTSFPALSDTLAPIVSDDVKDLAQRCVDVGTAALAAPEITGYAQLTKTTAACTTDFAPGGAAFPNLEVLVAAGVEEQRPVISGAATDGITGVAVTDLTNETQVGALLEKCKDQEEDLAAIEQAQILLPGGAAAAGVAALLLFVAVATAKAPLVLAGGFMGVVGGVVTLVALLGVRNAPVYQNVGSEVEDGEIEYKAGLGSTLGLVGIGAPVVGGLLGVGSFFCGSDEGGNELSSKVDNTY